MVEETILLMRNEPSAKSIIFDLLSQAIGRNALCSEALSKRRFVFHGLVYQVVLLGVLKS